MRLIFNEIYETKFVREYSWNAQNDMHMIEKTFNSFHIPNRPIMFTKVNAVPYLYEPELIMTVILDDNFKKTLKDVVFKPPLIVVPFWNFGILLRLKDAYNN